MTADTGPFDWKQLLAPGRALVGMVHIGALPGTPGSAQPVDRLIEHAVAEARVLELAGFDAVIIENMHDVPYVHGDRLGPEIVASMTLAAAAVRRAVGLPVGIQILSGGNAQALAAAHVTGCSFIRCENFVFSHVADEGLLPEAEAGRLLRYRRQLGADRVGVFCDIKKKHASHAITGDVPIEQVAEAAEFFCADALIVTGSHTGQRADPAELRAVAERTSLPVIVGSGADASSIGSLFEHASAVIVGSAIKAGGDWRQPVDEARAAQLVAARDRISSA